EREDPRLGGGDHQVSLFLRLAPERHSVRVDQLPCDPREGGLCRALFAPDEEDGIRARGVKIHPDTPKQEPPVPIALPDVDERPEQVDRAATLRGREGFEPLAAAEEDRQAFVWDDGPTLRADPRDLPTRGSQVEVDNQTIRAMMAGDPGGHL